MNKLTTFFNLIFSAAFIVFVMFCVYILISSHSEAVASKSDFDQAPNCTPTASPTSKLQPCTVEVVRVIDKEHHSNGGGKHRHEEYYVNMETISATLPPIEIFESFYDSITDGIYMNAKVWRGVIVSLDYQGQSYQTIKNPDIYGLDEAYPLLLFVVGIGAIIVVFGFGLNCLIQWKTLQGDIPAAAPAAPPSSAYSTEYPLVKDDD